MRTKSGCLFYKTTSMLKRNMTELRKQFGASLAYTVKLSLRKVLFKKEGERKRKKGRKDGKRKEGMEGGKRREGGRKGGWGREGKKKKMKRRNPHLTVNSFEEEW